MVNKRNRIEKDSMGEVKIPKNALWGPQTQRAIQNFPVSGISFNFPFGPTFIKTLEHSWFCSSNLEIYFFDDSLQRLAG